MDLSAETLSTENLSAEFDHPVWTAGAATVASYGLALLGLFALLFVVPFLLFLLL